VEKLIFYANLFKIVGPRFCDSSVITEKNYRTIGNKSISAWGQRFIFSTASEAHPASYSMATRDSFLWDKEGEA
jgi:hypothetical protein